MTKEKELGIFIAEMVNGLPDSGDNFKDCFTLAKAIIAKYPQITKKPVKVTFYDNLKYFPMKYCPVIEETIEKEQRQEWIDQHYVEVVE